MDTGVYPLKELSDSKLAQLIHEKTSFVVTSIERLNFSEAVETIEKAIEVQGLKCRVYTKGRAAAIGAAWIAPTVFAGVGAAIGISVHNLVTWNPDYEIAKNIATGSLTVNYKK